ncbi:MAG: cobalamin-dependent protein [Deltaproteobacteria bacterium]|nr:cobalamin-dependent protein [Deltaproteobacteria bacterium]
MPQKILLLDPPHKVFGALRMWMPSPGLMSLSAYIEANGFDVDLMDATILDQPWTDLEHLLKRENYDIVGITCSAATFHFDAIYAARLIRDTLPDTLLIGGGGHFTINAERILPENPAIDCIVLGEGENTFLEIIKMAEANQLDTFENIKGLAYRKDNVCQFSASRSLIADLDALPFPAYHKIQLNHFIYNMHGMGRQAVGLSTSRGCGDNCSYCSESILWNASWRGRSGPMVVKEMKMLNEDYHKSLFVFNENSFNQDRKRNEAFLESLGRSGLKCDFWFQSRVKDILRDRDLIDDYKRLGLYEVMLGVESISPETLKHYSKKQTIDQIREAAELLRSKGIMVMTNVMFGDVDDTEDTLSDIYDFATKIGDFLVLCITTPLPGTRYYDLALSQGRIEETDFSLYDFMHPIMPNNAYNRDQILALQKKYLRKYYTRPKIFLKMIFSLNPFIRMAYKLIMRYAWYEARNIEWVQKNHQDVPEKLK